MYNNPNVTVHFNTEALDVVSNTKDQMSGILLKKVDTGEESVLEVKGLFYGIGHSPNSHLLEGQVELDSSGYVRVKEGTAKTSVEGVFAAGDIQVDIRLIPCILFIYICKETGRVVFLEFCITLCYVELYLIPYFIILF